MYILPTLISVYSSSAMFGVVWWCLWLSWWWLWWWCSLSWLRWLCKIFLISWLCSIWVVSNLWMFWFIWCSSVITILSRCSMALTNLSDQCGDVSLRSVRCGLCLGVNRELFILILSEHNGCFEFHGRQPAQPKEKLLDQCKLLRDFTRMKLYIHRQLMCSSS